MSRAFHDDVGGLRTASTREIYERNTEAAAQRVRELIDEGYRAGGVRKICALGVRRRGHHGHHAPDHGSGEIERATGLSDAEAYANWLGWWSLPFGDDTSARRRAKPNIAAQMDDELHALGEDLITTAARMVRWTPKEDFNISLAAARFLARLHENGPTRISELAWPKMLSADDHQPRQAARSSAAGRPNRRSERRPSVDDQATQRGHQQLTLMRIRIGTSLEPYLRTDVKRDSRHCATVSKRCSVDG